MGDSDNQRNGAGLHYGNNTGPRVLTQPPWDQTGFGNQAFVSNFIVER